MVPIFILERKPMDNSDNDYRPADELKEILKGKFVLDCGHKVTLQHNLGNNIIVINRKPVKIICTECGY
jgi:hypothetical protein